MINKDYSQLRTALMHIEVNLDTDKRKELDEEIRTISRYLRKEAPKMVTYEYYNDPFEAYFYCPNCCEELNEKDEDTYCKYCGQLLNWSFKHD